MSLFSKIAERFQRADPKVTAEAVAMAASMARLYGTTDEMLAGLEDVLRRSASVMADAEHGRKLTRDEVGRQRAALNASANLVSQARASARALAADIEQRLQIDAQR